MKYIITAKSANGFTLFYRAEMMNGHKMIPNAQSIATQLDSRADALKQIEILSFDYSGLSNWAVERVK